MDVKQNATLQIQKGDNTHVYHVPPAASLPEVYDCLREMVSYVYGRLKQDFDTMQSQQAPVAQPDPAQPAPAEAPVAPAPAQQ
jgi:hypothetical protein